MTDWPYLPVRRVFRVVNGGTPSSDSSNWNGSVPWATPVDLARVNGTVVRSTERTLSEEGLEAGSNAVPAGSLIVSTRAPIGYVAETTERMAFNQGCRGLVPVAPSSSRYFRYQLLSLADELAERGQGSTFLELSGDALAATKVVVPPVAAQGAIADYLDRETARIDALIGAKRRMVELLEERWVAIRHRFTQMEEPARKWSSVQLRRVAEVQAGAAFPHENQGDASGSIPYVKVVDLANVDKYDRLRDAANRVAPEVATALRSPVLPAGTIVLPKIGAALLTNRRAVLSEPSCLDQNVMGVTVHAGHPQFVYYCLAAIDLGELSTPGPVPLLNEDAALSVRLRWPTAEEQETVVRELDAHRVVAKATADAIDRQVNLLNERRQALITAAVTGQLDIQEAA